jgi:hypothetical protein
LTWEQFNGWLRYHNEEPWGEDRADMRSMVQAMWINSDARWEITELPDPIYPYRRGDDPEAIASAVDQINAHKARILSGGK